MTVAVAWPEKMKTKLATIILAACAAGMFGCDAIIGNPWLTQAKNLEEEFRANPKDTKPIARLTELARSRDTETSVYALVALGKIGHDFPNPVAAIAGSTIIRAMKEGDRFVQREAAGAIVAAGRPLFDQAFPLLVETVQAGNNNDVTWYAIDALGEHAEAKDAELVSKLLAQSALRSINQTEAPQTFLTALFALRKIRARDPKFKSAVEAVLGAAGAPGAEVLEKLNS